MEEIKKFVAKNKKYIYVFLVVLCGIIMCFPLFNEKLDVFKDDGIQHVIRIEETKKAIKNGVSTKVFYDLYNGFGYSWDIFYGNFTSIIPSIISIIANVDSVNAFKIFIGIVIILSGLSMYFSTLILFDNKEISLVSAVLYMFAPYHVNDLYVRYAIRRKRSFCFYPTCFFGNRTYY